MRSSFVVMSLCLPFSLLTGCPGDDGTAESGASEGPTSAEGTTSTPDTTSDTSSSVTQTSATSSSDTATDTSASDTDTDTDTGGPIAGCECILDEVPTDPNSGPAAPTCGESICPLVVGGCVDDVCDGGAPFVLDDPAALDCALTALRDRTPGLVTWSYSEGSGFVTQDGYLLIDEDVTVVWRDWIREDLNFTVSDAVLGELPPAATYEACLADPVDVTRFNCLTDPLATQLGVCDEGWECVECI